MDQPHWKSATVEKIKTERGEEGASESEQQRRPRPQFHVESSSQYTSKISANLELPLGTVFSTISRSDLSEFDFPIYQAKVTNVKDIASYSWVEGQESTIIVPGILPKWTSKNKTIWTNLDKGDYFKDPNAARFPSYPLAPVVQAIFETDVDFQPSEIGLVACGSSIGNLLRFVQQDYNIKSYTVSKSFRFLVEVVGDTVFFVRREKSPTETIANMHGYWHGFIKEQTISIVDSAGATESHQRIVGYQFAGMNMLVRFEADGHLPHPQEVSGISYGQEQAKTDEAIKEDPTTNTQDLIPDTGLEVVAGKWGVPLSALFDLKTRTIKYQHRNILEEQLPRLWIRQLPYFIVAYHESGSGCFHPVNTKMSNVTEAIIEWEQRNENDLRKLVSLINKIVSAVKKMPDGRLEVRCGEDGDILELRSQTADVPPVLPTGLAARWCSTAEALKEESKDMEMGM
ncbi:hypothetical protein FKW77_005531 [Venturia effusa]|uniref:Geranylgeranyl pyrophosphate synthetase n=1 Tax=Venturia effusa TaxID=50376 RepID=A0A517LMU7_9PEZI|nr:hypothetical protein FKW77_005531 [Venturia effusa]